MRRAFTLIELLVVIGIIALLAAIIFPVFNNVRENNRANSSMSNLHDISTKLELYKLDHQAYPPILFGYAYTNLAGVKEPMDAAYAAALADDQAHGGTGCGVGNTQSCVGLYFPGLYPEYINSVAEFRDANNDTDLTKTQSIDPAAGAGNYAPSLALCAGTTDDDTGCPSSNAKGALVISLRKTKGTPTVQLPTALYKADAYDSSPQVTSSTTINLNLPFVVRYSTSYTAVTTSGSPPTNLQSVAPDTQSSLYTRQMRWLQPPGTTYVTCTTWHVPQSSKVLMLLLDGTVKKTDTSIFLEAGPDGPLTLAADASNYNTCTTPFWRINP